MFRCNPPFMSASTYAQLVASSSSLKRASPTSALALQTDSQHDGNDATNETEVQLAFSPKRHRAHYSTLAAPTSTDTSSPLSSPMTAPSVMEPPPTTAEDGDLSLSAAVHSWSSAPTMDLFSLPDSWLIDIIRLLDCRTLLRVKRTCTAAVPLVNEAVNTTASSSTFLSTSPSLIQAFNDLVTRCLSHLSTPPSVVLLFLSPSYPNSSMSAALSFLSSRLPPHCRLIGCHGIGILGRDCETDTVREMERGERAVSMFMMHLPGVDVQTRFVDIKSLEENLQDDYREAGHLNAGKVSPGAMWLAERLSLTIPQAPSLAPSFIVLSSPVTTVSDLLDCLYQVSPASTITGALASGGRPTSVGLLTRQDDGTINLQTYGVAVLILTPKPAPPPQTATSELLLADPTPSYPVLSGFASRGCKACSGVYRIVTSSNDVIGLVRQVQSLPEEDAQYDPLLHPEVMEQLVGGGTADRQEARQQATVQVNEPDEDEKEVEPSDPSARHPMYTVGTPVMDVRAVFHQVMQHSTGQDGYINGLFIGISDETESKEGRVLCDIVELQSTGIKIETSTFHAISESRSKSASSSSASTSASSPAPLSLQGKYMQLFELDPSACMVDLANRVRHLSRRPDAPSPTADCSPVSASSLSSSGSSLLPSALLFTCSGRGSQFYARSNIDSSIVTHQSGLDVCGFCCNGEIGPPARSLQVHSWMQAEDRERRRQRRRAAADDALLAAASLDENESAVEQPSLVMGLSSSEGEGSELTASNASLSAAREGAGPTCEPAVLQSYTAVVTTFNSHCR